MDPINTFTNYGRELMFMPTITFGYIYTIREKLDISYTPLEVPTTSITIGTETIFLTLTSISLLSSCLLYLAIEDKALIETITNNNILIEWSSALLVIWGLGSYFVITPLVSLYEINHGDILLNTLVLINVTSLIFWIMTGLLRWSNSYNGEVDLTNL